MDVGPRTMNAKIQAIPRHQKRFSTREEHRTNKNNNALIAERDQGIMELTREPLVEGVAMHRNLVNRKRVWVTITIILFQ